MLFAIATLLIRCFTQINLRQPDKNKSLAFLQDFYSYLWTMRDYWRVPKFAPFLNNKRLLFAIATLLIRCFTQINLRQPQFK